MKSRSGITLVELMVAAMLVISGLAIIGKLSIASGRMWQQTRHEQVALEELSNQLERLVALPPEQRRDAIAQLEPSAFAVERLPGVTITSQSLKDHAGQRITLQINWNRFFPAKPLTLVGWFGASSSNSDAPQEPV